DLFCGDSAATMRFMTAVSSLVPGKCRIVPGASLSRRPVKPLIEALRQMGVDCSCLGEGGAVAVRGGSVRGGVVELPGDVSSQFVSALLLIGPFADEPVRITLTTPLESKPYVLMTVECLERFGVKVEMSEDLSEFKVLKQTYRPTRYEVEGDWSSASCLLALGALCGEVGIENLNPESLQSDKAILDLLRDMGATVHVNQQAVVVTKSKLNAIRADLSDCIDLLPAVAVLAAAANGVSELVGIERARIKESNRVAALREGLERMGIRVGEDSDRLTIAGAEPRGAVIDTWHDHRIAMAFGALGLAAGGTVINGAECVSKTFPEFWERVKSIGGEVKISGQ
ncbi:MAG: 3-phosphoshikimate 1-carboxyvinyltransferase, partial [Dehalococcoidia bacterium]|nr:3-phosphoshikimate 1-carboxyvinyltransferase [Dehalococcoidia bacterium]